MQGVFTDWTGKRVGNLVVLRLSEDTIKKKSKWVCLCECGQETIVHAVSLKSETTKSCGCLKSKNQINLAGNKFNRWTVIEKSKNKVGHWLCRCDCGTLKELKGQSVRTGHTKSCGCYKLEITTKRMTTHNNSGKNTKTPEYRAWAGMISRCTNSKTKQFHDYGGRGIKVSEDWRYDFERFLEDMGTRPSIHHSLDRIDVNGNYEKDNCRWATTFQQAQNRRTSILSSSGTPGVKWYERLNKWQVDITVNKKRIYLGVFSDREEAEKVRKNAELKYWGKSS